MNWFGLVAAMALPLSSGFGQSPVAPIPSPTAVVAPTNSFAPPAASLSPNLVEVVKLSRAGLSNELVLAFVNSSQSLYNLSATDVLHLKEMGISPTIITAMLKHDSFMRNPNPSGPSNYAYNPPLQPASPPPVIQPGAPPETAASVVAPQTPPLVASAVVPPAPAPVPLVEYVPVAPGPDFYWAPGYWGWDNGWVWIGGGWNLRIGLGWGWGGYRGWGGYHHGGGGYHGGHH